MFTREDKIVQAIKTAQFQTMEAAFKTPPQSFDAFRFNVGFYQGLNAALQAVEDSKKDTDDD